MRIDVFSNMDNEYDIQVQMTIKLKDEIENEVDLMRKIYISGQYYRSTGILRDWFGSKLLYSSKDRKYSNVLFIATGIYTTRQLLFEWLFEARNKHIRSHGSYHF